MALAAGPAQVEEAAAAAVRRCRLKSEALLALAPVATVQDCGLIAVLLPGVVCARETRGGSGQTSFDSKIK